MTNSEFKKNIIGESRLSVESIQKAVEIFEKDNYSDKLESIYSKVEEGVCTGCAKCCIESVNATFAEFINVLSKINEMDKDKGAKIINRILYFIENELSEKMDCPFLEDIDSSGKRRCAIHFARPLECRVFGHMNKDEYEEDYVSILRENRNAAQEFKEYYGVEIPEYIITRKLEWCEDFKTGKRIDRAMKKSLIQELITLDFNFVEKDIIEDYELGGSLMQWFDKAAFSGDASEALRVESVRKKQG